jgi:hypothetical protein
MDSLASSTSGLICAFFSASALGMRAPAASKHSPSPIRRQRQMRQRSQIAARAHAALRRHEGSDAAVQHFAQRVDDDPAHARETLGQRIGAQQHHGARFRRGERFADSDGVRTHQVDLQLANLVAGNAHIAELAHAGSDRIGQLVAGDNLVDHRARPVHGLARIGRQSTGRRSAPTSRTASRVRSLPLM